MFYSLFFPRDRDMENRGSRSFETGWQCPDIVTNGKTINPNKPIGEKLRRLGHGGSPVGAGTSQDPVKSGTK